MTRPLWDKRATTAIYVQVKRVNSSFFILVDEYETIESLKKRLLDVLIKAKLTMKGYDQPFTIDDLCLNEQNRVSAVFNKLTKNLKGTVK